MDAELTQDVSEERIASNIRVRRTSDLGTALAVKTEACQLLVSSNVPSSPIFTLMMEALLSSETSVLTRATRRHISEDGVLHSHRREILKSYIALTGLALQRRRNVSPVRYEVSFYIPEDAILHSRRRENLKSYI
jgi:hypothetical protein